MAESNGELTVEQALAKLRQPKVCLSRYQNERRSYLHQTGSKIEKYGQLVEREREQERVLRAAVSAWKAQERK